MAEVIMSQKNVLLPLDDMERFHEIHPGHGSYAWFARKCLSLYIRLFDEAPEEKIREAVEHIKDSDDTPSGEKE